MVRYPTAMAASVDTHRVEDTHRASLIGGVVVVVGLIISLLLVAQV